MKVLVQNRPDAFSAMGGDTIQMIKTVEYLRKMGVAVEVSLDLQPNLRDYDLVHLMNITRVEFTYLQMKNAKRFKKPVFLSPIYWNTKRALSSYVKETLRNLNLFRFAKDIGSGYLRSILRNEKISLNEVNEILNNKKFAATVLREVDHLLPNSLKEFEILKHDFPNVFKDHRKKFSVVPNGVDSKIFCSSSPRKFVEKTGLSDFVLCVGRFGFRKNQLSLIKALKGSGIPIVFIGDAPIDSKFYWVKDAADRTYFHKCKREADSSCVFLPNMSHSALASAYAACKVLALPSFYETPGLVALEAALAGANVCITQEGSTSEYFLDYAYYCDPYSLDSIRHAVLQAYQAPKNKLLKQHVLENFTWEHVARATLNAYKQAIQD
jgi:glycosyltransferase involved in cell wall biosynthesis